MDVVPFRSSQPDTVISPVPERIENMYRGESSQSQQTSTPKYDRRNAPILLFNANESAILDPDSSPLNIGGVEAVMEIVQQTQTTYKRRRKYQKHTLR